MNNYFRHSLINELTCTIFILCSYLLQVQTNNIYWNAVLLDLEVIQNNFNKSFSQVDSFLYTAEDDIDACMLSAMRCFLLEIDVIFYEFPLKDGDTNFKKLSLVWRNINASLESTNQDKVKEAHTCRQCESFEEKNFPQFIKGLENAVQRINKRSQRGRF